MKKPGTHEIADAIKTGFDIHGITGQITVKAGGNISTVFAGRPSKNDVIIAVTIEQGDRP